MAAQRAGISTSNNTSDNKISYYVCGCRVLMDSDPCNMARSTLSKLTIIACNLHLVCPLPSIPLLMCLRKAVTLLNVLADP